MVFGTSIRRWNISAIRWRHRVCAQHFVESHRLLPQAKYLLNAGLCYDKAENFPDALSAFERYLKADPNTAKVDEVTQRIELLKYKIKDVDK